MSARRKMAWLATATVASFLTLSSVQQAWTKDLGEEIQALVEGAIGKAEDRADRGEARDGVPAGKAVLEVTGDRGTRFAGTCAAGDREDAIEGRAPETYTYDLDDRRLDCKIKNRGGGDLRIVFDAKNAHSEQSLGSEGGVAKLVYDEDGILMTSSLSGSSGQTSVQRSSSSRGITSRAPDD